MKTNLKKVMFSLLLMMTGSMGAWAQAPQYGDLLDEAVELETSVSFDFDLKVFTDLLQAGDTIRTNFELTAQSRALAGAEDMMLTYFALVYEVEDGNPVEVAREGYEDLELKNGVKDFVMTEDLLATLKTAKKVQLKGYKVKLNKVELIEKPKPIIEGKKGDVNGDDEVNITDVVFILDVMAGSITDANIVKQADVNGDGEVNITDVVAVLDIMAGGN